MKKLFQFLLCYLFLLVNVYAQINGPSSAVVGEASTYTLDELTLEPSEWTVTNGGMMVQIQPPYSAGVIWTVSQIGTATITCVTPTGQTFTKNVTVTASPTTTEYWIKNNSNELYYNGNIGIGIADPAHKLDVNGAARISGLDHYDSAPAQSGRVVMSDSNGKLYYRTIENITGTIDTNTQLSEAQISGMGFIKDATDADSNPTNEIQDLYLNGHLLKITDKAGAEEIDLSVYLDNTDTQLTKAEISGMGFIKDPSDADSDPTNEIQDLNLTDHLLKITDKAEAEEIDLSVYLDNTDTQLTEDEVDAFVEDNGYIKSESLASLSRINLNNNEHPSSSNEGDIYYDRNVYSDTDNGFHQYFTGGNGGALAYYNPEDGWGALLSTSNMKWITPTFHALNVNSDISATGNVTGANLNISNWNTAFDQRGSEIAGNGLKWDDVNKELYIDGVNTDSQDLDLNDDHLLTLTGDPFPETIDLSIYLDNTVLTETQVDAYADNNGYLKSGVEIQPTFGHVQSNLIRSNGNNLEIDARGYNMIFKVDTDNNSNGFYKWQGDGNDIMLLTDKGRLGIGTTDPKEALHVNGSIRGNQSGAIRIRTGVANSSGEDGYVDIGPKNSTYSHFITNMSRYYFNKEIRVNGGRIGSHTDQNLSLRTGGTTHVTLENGSGNLGIGTTEPSEKLDVVGGARISGLNHYDSAPAETGRIVMSDSNGKLYYRTIQNIAETIDTNTQLTEAEISGLGFIKDATDADSNPTNEIQDLDLNGHLLKITDKAEAEEIDLSLYLDNTDSQDLSISGNTLSLTNDATSVSLSKYDEVISLNEETNILSATNGGGSADLNKYLDNTDNQNLSFDTATGELSIDNGTSVNIGSIANNYWKESDGDVYYDAGKVGVGVNPTAQFHVKGSGPILGYFQQGATSGKDAGIKIRGSRSACTSCNIAYIDLANYDKDDVGDEEFVMARIVAGTKVTNGKAGHLSFYTNQGASLKERIRINRFGKAYIYHTGDADVSADGALTLGSIAGRNLTIDDNEIMARNNGAHSTLNLNINGGLTSVGGGLAVKSGNITVDEGNIDVTGNASVSGTINALDGNSTEWNDAYAERGSQIAGTGLEWSAGKLNVENVNTDEQTLSFNSTNGELTIDGGNTVDIGGVANNYWIGGSASSISYQAGQVAIGTDHFAVNYSLSVLGGIVTDEINVALPGSTDWPDYVFAKGYSLRSLKETEEFIEENHHLPDVPSASEIKEDGINVGEMNAVLLRKIEELTLHLIQQNKQIEALQTKVNELENK